MGYRVFPMDSLLVEITPQGLPRGDRDGTSADYAAAEYARFTDGVANLDNADAAKVVAGSGMSVQIKPGTVFILGRHITFDEDGVTITIPVGGSYPRIDRIVTTLDTHDAIRDIVPSRLAGIADVAPAAPTLTRDKDTQGITHQLSLARILVPAGATSIAQCTITDERADTGVCGYSYARRAPQPPAAGEGVTFGDLVDLVKVQGGQPAALANKIWIQV